MFTQSIFLAHHLMFLLLITYLLLKLHDFNLELFYLSFSQLFAYFNVVMNSFLCFRFLFFSFFKCLRFAVHVTQFLFCLHLIWTEDSFELFRFGWQNVLVYGVQGYVRGSFGHVILFAITWAMVKKVLDTAIVAFSTSTTSWFASRTASAVQAGWSISWSSILQTLKCTILNSAHRINPRCFLLIGNFLLPECLRTWKVR
jgi:hypothetical protein